VLLELLDWLELLDDWLLALELLEDDKPKELELLDASASDDELELDE